MIAMFNLGLNGLEGDWMGMAYKMFILSRGSSSLANCVVSQCLSTAPIPANQWRNGGIIATVVRVTDA